MFTCAPFPFYLKPDCRFSELCLLPLCGLRILSWTVLFLILPRSQGSFRVTCSYFWSHVWSLDLVFVQHTDIILLTDWLTWEKRSNASNSKIKTLIGRLSTSISSSVDFLKGSWPCLLTSSHQSLFAWHQMPLTQTHASTCMHSHFNTPTPWCNPPPPK